MTWNNMTQKALIHNPEDRIMCVKVGIPNTLEGASSYVLKMNFLPYS